MKLSVLLLLLVALTAEVHAAGRILLEANSGKSADAQQSKDDSERRRPKKGDVQDYSALPIGGFGGPSGGFGGPNGGFGAPGGVSGGLGSGLLANQLASRGGGGGRKGNSRDQAAQIVNQALSNRQPSFGGSGGGSPFGPVGGMGGLGGGGSSLTNLGGNNWGTPARPSSILGNVPTTRPAGALRPTPVLGMTNPGLGGLGSRPGLLQPSMGGGGSMPSFGMRPSTIGSSSGPGSLGSIGSLGNLGALGAGTRPTNLQSFNQQPNRYDRSYLTGLVPSAPPRVTGSPGPLSPDALRFSNNLASADARSAAQSLVGGRTDIVAEGIVDAAARGRGSRISDAIASAAVLNRGATASVLTRGANLALQRGQVTQFADSIANAFVTSKQRGSIKSLGLAMADAVSQGGTYGQYTYGQAMARAVAQGADGQQAVAEATAEVFCQGNSYASAWSSAFAIALSQDQNGCLVLSKARALAVASCGGGAFNSYSESDSTSKVLGFCGMFPGAIPGFNFNTGNSGSNTGGFNSGGYNPGGGYNSGYNSDYGDYGN